MSRPTTFTKEQKERAMQMRNDGYMWQVIADELGVSKDSILYHCSEGRREQVQKSIKKYQKNNYEKMRDKQRQYADNSKVQQEASRDAVETGGVQEEAVEGLDKTD